MIIIGWTLLDLIELVLIISYRNQSLKYFKNHFLLKLLGSVVFIYIASMLQTTEGGAFFSDIDRRFLVPLIVSAILHSGVFTYKNLLVDQEISIAPFPIRILPFISSLSSVFFLGYVPFSVENWIITIPFAIFIFVMVAIISVIDFSTRESNLEKYLALYIFTGLILLSFLAGLLRKNSVIIVLLLFPYFWELLSTHSSKSIKLVRILFYLLISGLSMALPVYNFGNEFGLIEILGLIVIVILLSYVYARYFFQGQKTHADLDSLEPWFQFFYIGGFTVLVISAARLIVRIIRQFEGVLQFWWVPASLITLVAVFYFLFSRSDEKVKSLKAKPKLKIFEEIRTSRVFPNFFAALFSALSGLFGFTTGLFEGGGGILWAVTILALFLTLLSIRGGF